jgi:hypothetical protein
MKSKLFTLVVAVLFVVQVAPAFASTTNVYSTQFENVQGYNINLDLIGQAGWLGSGSGGNGILSNAIPGQGQQAYIGFDAPNPADDSLVIWKPIDFNAVAAGYPIVKFSTQMRIEDSTTSRYDIFRWSIYNTQGNRLFSLDFDNDFLDIAYLLDGTNQIVFTTNTFVNATTYTLTVTMNFASNRWSASFNNALIATNQMITSTNAPLNLGDVDAVWFVNQISGTNAPGDNYMIFDNYTITAEMPPAQVQFLGRTGDGWSLLRVNGQKNSSWSLDATTNLVNWTAILTNTISGTFFDHVDATSAGLPRRFYRARLVQ